MIINGSCTFRNERLHNCMNVPGSYIMETAPKSRRGHTNKF